MGSWCLHLDNPGTRESYIQGELELPYYVSVLNSGRIKLHKLNSLDTEIKNRMINLTYLFSPTEQTEALHKILHISEQIKDIGPSRFNNLFMYERVNKTLNGMIKNLAKPLPSIVKAYAVTLLTIIITQFLHAFD